MRRLAQAALAAATLLVACASPPAVEGRLERRVADERVAPRLRYRLDVPAPAGRPDAGWPLVLFLHGAGERGDDLARVAVHGPPKLVLEVPELGRCVLVCPLCPANAWWDARSLLAVLDEVRGLVHVDDDRVYVTGLSMGGYATWNLLAERPDLFAAAVPICGGGEIGRVWAEFGTGFELERLLRARDVPVRAFHGDADRVVPVEESRLLVEALEAVDADVALVEYAGVGHDAWTRTYADPELWRWMFAQRRD